MRRILIVAALIGLALPAAAQTYQAAVVTPWTGTGTKADPYRPLLAKQYPALTWDDVTGQPVSRLKPDPNTYTLLVTCDGDTLDAIEDDAAFVVLWTEVLDGGEAPKSGGDELLKEPERKNEDRPKQAKPSAAEVAKLRGELRSLGYSAPAAAALVRDGVAREVIQADVVTAQKAAPKG